VLSHAWLPSGTQPQYGGKSLMGSQTPPAAQAPPQLKGPPPHGASVVVVVGTASMKAGMQISCSLFGACVLNPSSDVHVRSAGGLNGAAGFAR
jgi:hypothetical protein